MKNSNFDFGLVGLGVMGRNFILNVADKGFSAYGYDLDSNQVQALVQEGGNTSKVNSTVNSARELVAYAVQNGIPLPGLSNSIIYFDAYSSGRLHLNLIQAQRDYFGSHTHERLDKEGVFHTKWE